MIKIILQEQQQVKDGSITAIIIREMASRAILFAVRPNQTFLSERSRLVASEFREQFVRTPVLIEL